MEFEEQISELKRIIGNLQQAGRHDLLLQAIGTPLLEQLRIEAAREELVPLRITADHRFILEKRDGEVEVEMSPVHKALYMLFLRHEEGIEFKRLSEHREELLHLYQQISNRVSSDTINDTINRLTDPLDNATNEKCSRIKNAFAAHLDEYSLRYYIIGNHTQRRFSSSNRVWFERKKSIQLPRHLIKEDPLPALPA